MTAMIMTLPTQRSRDQDHPVQVFPKLMGEEEGAEDLSPIRAPPTLMCTSDSCSHLIVLGSHFDREQWEHFREADRKRHEQQRE